jgi:alkanesulfonate monooxygenase SsuD/methylene tetrahydromethanopterin reductase-like flavin-dependent oxidoreductase (luciferase family)
MRIGLFLAYQRIHAPEAYDTNLYEEMLELAVEGDRLGVDMLWVPEHHLIHLMQTPSAAVLATQIGLKVGCRVGTMVSLLNYRHPLISAGELALVDNVLGGRFEVGVGRGAYEYEFERLGIPFAEGKERLAEALDVLQKIWDNDEAISYQGRFTSFDEALVWPRPVQQPHPPIWVAAMTAPTVEWAARLGYHVVNWPFMRDMSVVEKTAQLFHATREEMGVRRGHQRLGILRQGFVAETEAEAAATLDDALVAHRINQRLHYFTQNADKRGYVYPEPVDDEPNRDDMYRNLLMGTPEQCLAKVEEYHELGVDDLLINLDFGPSHADVMRSLRLFGEEVLRPYRERHPSDLLTIASRAIPSVTS